MGGGERRAGDEAVGWSRRAFLAGVAGVVVAACSNGDDAASPASTDSTPTTDAPDPEVPIPEADLPAAPFTLGVASGDVRPGSVVLWSRLAPEPTVAGGGMPGEPVDARWQVARDEAFDDVVAAGIATAEAEHAHSLHVVVEDLEPSTTYHYRFQVGSHTSPTGRTRTAPPEDATVEAVTLGVTSCQAYQSGFYAGYRHLAAEDLDAVCFLGDYIYELEPSTAARAHGLNPPGTLDEYRVLYAVNKSDPDLQAAHAAHPWIVTWDDHEVEDNYAGLQPGGIGLARGVDPATFPDIRAAAYQAWWEHMPVRGGPPADDGSLTVHHRVGFGSLVTLAVLDDRQHRSPLVTGEGAGNLPRGAGGGPLLPGTFDETRTMLGEEQERWLADVLTSSTTTWTVLVQQTVMAELDRFPNDPERGFSMDAWDGYVAARERLLGLVRDEGVANLVSLGGDIHTAAVTDLYDTYRGENRTLVGTELIAPSLSAIELLPPDGAAGARSNPHVHLYEPDRRGYLTISFEADRATAAYRFVSDALDPDATIETASTWTVAAGTPGAREA